MRPPTEMELTDPDYAYLYARNVLRAPFPAGENALARDPFWAYHYARDILRAPFPAGEAAITSSPRRKDYDDLVRRWKENHEEFMKDLEGA